jgi:hypothetical protein
VTNCDVLNRGSESKTGNVYTANERGAACDFAEMNNLDTTMSYLMRLKGSDESGRSLKFFLFNTGSERNDLEYLTKPNVSKSEFDQTFGILPWEFAGSYTLNIETRSFGELAKNTLQPVEVRYIPLKQLAGIKVLQATGKSVENSTLKIEKVDKTGTWLYRVQVSGSGLLRLSQGYDEGWISIGLPHVKVDGWANGWIIPSSGMVTIFYWPQLLEYFGFIVLGTTVIVLIFKRK